MVSEVRMEEEWEFKLNEKEEDIKKLATQRMCKRSYEYMNIY